MTRSPGNLERRWARAGVLFNCAPSAESPDIERLLLDTARGASANPRLRPLVVTWLSRYAPFVARHRLRRLVVAELEERFQPILGLILAEAVEFGAPRDLLVAGEVCRAASPAHPLDGAFAESGLALVAQRTATPLSRRWGVLAPPFALRPDALRPARWILRRNPHYRERVVRKGDLRATIIETLRWDVPGGRAPSVSALARLTGATRAAVLQALAALELEGAVVVGKSPANERDVPVALTSAA